MDKPAKGKKALGSKRTWLANVDYKNGGLISENKKKEKEAKKIGIQKNQGEIEANDNEPAAGQKKRKSNFLSSKHKDEHDNIFSKKFKSNKFEDKRKKRK
jgi:hypothetical protein